MFTPYCHLFVAFCCRMSPFIYQLFWSVLGVRMPGVWPANLTGFSKLYGSVRSMGCYWMMGFNESFKQKPLRNDWLAFFNHFLECVQTCWKYLKITTNGPRLVLNRFAMMGSIWNQYELWLLFSQYHVVDMRVELRWTPRFSGEKYIHLLYLICSMIQSNLWLYLILFIYPTL